MILTEFLLEFAGGDGNESRHDSGEDRDPTADAVKWIQSNWASPAGRLIGRSREHEDK